MQWPHCKEWGLNIVPDPKRPLEQQSGITMQLKDVPLNSTLKSNHPNKSQLQTPIPFGE